MAYRKTELSIPKDVVNGKIKFKKICTKNEDRSEVGLYNVDNVPEKKLKTSQMWIIRIFSKTKEITEE